MGPQRPSVVQLGVLRMLRSAELAHQTCCYSYYRIHNKTESIRSCQYRHHHHLRRNIASIIPFVSKKRLDLHPVWRQPRCLTKYPAIQSHPRRVETAAITTSASTAAAFLSQRPYLHHHPFQYKQKTQSQQYHTSRINNMVQGVEIDDHGCIVNVNPATGEVISRVPCTPLDDIDTMIQQARGCEDDDSVLHLWSIETTLEERIEYLRRGLDILTSREDELVASIVQEMGKPLREAQEEVKWALSKRGEYMDVLQSALQPQRQPPPPPASSAYSSNSNHGNTLIVRQALGVVVILSPWNFPADEILLLALPALASGNVVLVKPSEVTPDTGAMVVSSLSQALPHSAILQLVQGDGNVGAALVAHPLVNLIAMTGSSATGRRILQSAAAGTATSSSSDSPQPPPLKRVVLEMGGKDPMIVFADADLDVAAKHAVTYSLANTGQVCCSIERIYVAQSIYEDFAQRVTDVAASFQVGNGMDPNVQVGPLVSQLQRDQVAEQVQDAIQRGAKVLYQSDIPNLETKSNEALTTTPSTTSSSSSSCFYPVTVLGDVTHDMDVFRRETFGPVVAMSIFDGSERQAIQLANQTEYGLASSVYTTDLNKAQRVANAIVAGQVGINCYAIEHMNVYCPWVGHKNSGYGFHSGVDGFHQFSIPKTIVFPPVQE